MLRCVFGLFGVSGLVDRQVFFAQLLDFVQESVVIRFNGLGTGDELGDPGFHGVVQLHLQVGSPVGVLRGEVHIGISDLSVENGNTPEEVLQDEEGLQVMRQLGRNMAWFLKLKEAGRQAGIPLPEQEEKRIATNFIR